MNGSCTAQQDGTNRHAITGCHLEQVVGDVGRIDIGHDQQVRIALEGCVRHHRSQGMGIQCGVTMHLTIDLKIRCTLSEQRERSPHFLRRLAVAAAEVGMRQQRSARLQTEAAHFFGGHDGDLSQLLCCGVFIHVGVDQHDLPIRQNQRIHCGVRIDTGALAQYLIDVVQVQVSTAEGTAAGPIAR